MSKRWLPVLFALLFLPALAQADDVPAGSASLLAPSSTSGLGPATGSLGNAGGSNADSTALQPAGNSPLQATTNDSSGLGAPATNTLQAPATSDDALRVVAGDGEGTRYDPNEPAGHWAWLWWTLGLAVVLTCITVVLRDRKRFREA